MRVTKYVIRRGDRFVRCTITPAQKDPGFGSLRIALLFATEKLARKYWEWRCMAGTGHINPLPEPTIEKLICTLEKT